MRTMSSGMKKGGVGLGWQCSCRILLCSEAFKWIESQEEVERVAGIELLMDKKGRMVCRCVGARARFIPGPVGHRAVNPRLRLHSQCDPSRADHVSPSRDPPNRIHTLAGFADVLPPADAPPPVTFPTDKPWHFTAVSDAIVRAEMLWVIAYRGALLSASSEHHMINLHRLISWLFPDRRPDWEQKREREFILAANKLNTLSVTDRGGMSIDPEELREHIIASREQLKHLVHNPGARSGPRQAVAAVEMAQEADPSVEGPHDCIEVVAWRRLLNGGAVRYVCLQSTHTGRYSVATACLFSGTSESLPTWVDGNTNRQVANALQGSELHWYATVSEAMNAWDTEL